MDPRILIVGTVPYNRRSTSRAFDSYFHGWNRDCLAQVFSNTKTPVKGHCGTLFQITDKRMLQRRFNQSVKTGRVFNYDELPSEWNDNDLEVGGGAYEKLYRIGSASNAYTHIARGFVWKERYWHTPELDAWLDAFAPECIFLSFSNDYFIPEIALYASRRFDVPVVSSIGDDYYFLRSSSMNPFERIYKRRFRRTIDEVFAHGGSAIYICDKIRDKYNSEFRLEGETVYLTSEATRREFRPIDTKNFRVSYFGNIRMGRNKSLCDIADALAEIDPRYFIEVYSNERERSVTQIFEKHPSLHFMGSVPYSEVLRKTEESDLVVVVEGHEAKDIELSRYSLSTKVADSLASGVNVLGYGSAECGAIDYMDKIGCITLCHEPQELVPAIKRLIEDEELQNANYIKSMAVVEQNHTLAHSTATFRRVVERAISEYRKARQ